MNQTRLESLIEALINTVIGFGINFVANIWIIPLFYDVKITPGKNFLMGVMFTVISVARSYTIRRWADKGIKQAVRSLVLRIRKGSNATS